MTQRGQTIRIFLADGSVTGIRHAEVVNWTGQAVACPRSRISELSAWEEAQRPGVYILFGSDDATARPAAYLGEAENVYVRLQEHLSKREFWNEVVFFTNKDENLTKAHVRYLEHKLLDSAIKAGRYVLENAAMPQGSRLPRGDADSMESFLDQIRVLLGVLGHRILEPIDSIPAARDTGTTGVVPAAKGIGGTILFLKTKAAVASSILTDEGIVVFAGSRAAAKVADSLPIGYRNLRQEMLVNGVLVDADGALVFARDQLFSSGSAAAAVIVGYMVNGREAWKTVSGQTLGALEAQHAPGVASQPLS